MRSGVKDDWAEVFESALLLGVLTGEWTRVGGKIRGPELAPLGDAVANFIVNDDAFIGDGRGGRSANGTVGIAP